MKGARWGRERDSAGIAYAQNRISAEHVKYLDMGGIDGFIGDGRIRYRPERALEAYYSAGLSRSLWVTLDLQHVANPAYNADRGPVVMYGARLHAEF